MIVPSLVTTRTGRLIGIIWLVGSTQRSLQGSGAASRADVAQVGADARSGGADAVTPGAGALAVEDGAPAGGISGLHRRGVERIHVAKVGDDARHLGVVQRERGHAGRASRP